MCIRDRSGPKQWIHWGGIQRTRRRSGKNTVGNLMERIAARKLARGLEDRGTLPANQGRGFRPEHAHGKMQMMCTKDPSGTNKQWLWQSISRMLTTESSSSCWWTCSFNMESAWLCRLQERSWKEQWLCSLETGLCSSSAYNGPTTRITALAGPVRCLYQGPGGSEPKWTQQDSHTGRWRGHIQIIKGLRGGSRSSATTTG